MMASSKQCTTWANGGKWGGANGMLKKALITRVRMHRNGTFGGSGKTEDGGQKTEESSNQLGESGKLNSQRNLEL